MQGFQQLHEKAILLARAYLKSESDLLGVILEIDRGRVFERLGYASLHQYIVGALRLSDAQAYNFASVARKSVVVPELRVAIARGELNVNTARKIVPVINGENQGEWIAKARELKQRDLEREVARENPREVVRERIRPVAEERGELRCGISVELEKKLRRVQDLESRRRKRACTLEEVFEVMVDEFLGKRDPVKRAERFAARQKLAVRGREGGAKKESQKVGEGGVKVEGRRGKLPAEVLHGVVMRDGNRCRHLLPGGERCSHRRWLEVHHVRPVSEGGGHELENLVTLCSGHHRARHRGHQGGG